MKSILIFCLIFLPFLAVNSDAAAFDTVVIDAGHGGNDNGCQWGKVYEKHITLDTSYRLAALLKNAGFKIVMTRSDDQFVSLGYRSKFSNQQSNAIFVSVHFNHTWKSDVCGIETFYCTPQSSRLASAVHSGVIGQLGGHNRGLKVARYSVIRNTTIPSILVEGGFVSHEDEREKLRTGEYRQRLAKGIADGVIQFSCNS